jgi:hypothetical protein
MEKTVLTNVNKKGEEGQFILPEIRHPFSPALIK